MAITFTDRDNKIVLKSWGRFKAVMKDAVEVGDLLAPYSGAATSTLRLADDAGGLKALAVACEDGAAGDEITCALAAELQAPYTLATGGVATQLYFIGSTDYIGSPLYLDDSGKCDETTGASTKQQVGWVSARDKIFLVPGVVQAATAGSFTTLCASGAAAFATTLEVTGNTTIGGTLEVTGIPTFTGAVAFNGGATVASAKNLTLTKGNLVMTEGNIVFTKGQVIEPINDGIDGAKTLDSSYGTLVCELTNDSTMTLPTAVAGLRYTFVHKSGDKVLTVLAGTSDKIIDPGDGGVHDKLYDDQGLDCHLTLVAADATNWVCTSVNGDWTGADS